MNYVKSLLLKERPNFQFPLRTAFKWWWAFCKKHSIISLYYKEPSQNANLALFKGEKISDWGSLSPSNFLAVIVFRAAERTTFGQKLIKKLVICTVPYHNMG